MNQTLLSWAKKIVVTALTILSRSILKKYKPFVFAVTGSVGKTSTKDALYTILAATSGKRVRRNEKSFNSETGVPLTIIGRPNGWYDVSSWLVTFWQGIKLIVQDHEYPEILVLEVGADKPNDIYDITRWLKPDVSVMTKVGRIAVHVEFFESAEHLLKEKSYLLDETKKGGHIILSADDSEVMKAGAGRDEKQGVTISTFGIASEATIKARNIEVMYDSNQKPLGMKADIVWNGNSETLEIKGALGKQFLYPSLAALTAAFAYGIDPRQGIKALSAHTPSKGRMNILDGLNDSLILDDTYNSSPDALREALNALGMVQGAYAQRKFVIIGDMMELGKYSVEQHTLLGAEVAKILSPQDFLFTIGQRAQGFAQGARSAGFPDKHIVSLSRSTEVAVVVKNMVKKGDIVLIKASQSIRAEVITETLLKDPAKAVDLLVRQEPEWKEKSF